MSLVTGRVVLPYGATRDTTPVCGHIRYVWVGGVQDKGELVIVPGVAIARIIDGMVEPVHLSPGRWLPVLVIDERRYDLPEITVDGSGVPTPAPDPTPTPAPIPQPHLPTPVEPAPIPSPGNSAPVAPEPPAPEPPAPPAPTVEVVDDGAYAITAATVTASEDGVYTVEFDGAHYAITHTGDGIYEIEEAMNG